MLHSFYIAAAVQYTALVFVTLQPDLIGELEKPG